ncbi:MAG: type II toxin-antitoxin system Phd/YefM family antitoxin [Caldilineaceae bacterium]|jgi:prevent-host-death family protein|nr:type II toxin-antitoxin system Phd/YefM family antitoxin [Caldilineaceae bacterium]
MHKLYQTIAAGDLKANTNAAFAMAEEGPVVVLSKATPKAVLVSPDEWNRIAQRLSVLEALVEAQRIEVLNETNQSWVTGAELRDRLAKRGVNVGSSL